MDIRVKFVDVKNGSKLGVLSIFLGIGNEIDIYLKKSFSVYRKIVVIRFSVGGVFFVFLFLFLKIGVFDDISL